MLHKMKTLCIRIINQQVKDYRVKSLKYKWDHHDIKNGLACCTKCVGIQISYTDFASAKIYICPTVQQFQKKIIQLREKRFYAVIFCIIDCFEDFGSTTRNGYSPT